MTTIYNANGKVYKKIKPKINELGGTGRYRNQRFQSTLDTDEYYSSLKFPYDINIYNKMGRSDAQVQAVLLMISLPIRATQWFIRPLDKSKKAQKIAEYIDKCLFSGVNNGLYMGFDEFIKNVTTMYQYGHSVFEKVFEIKKSMIKWKKFAVRPQSTIYDIHYDDVGDVNGISQYMIDQSWRQQYIDIDKLLIFSHNMEQGDIRGGSILRACYKHWYIKDFILKIMNVGIERNLVGTPVIKLPEGYTQDDKELSDQIVTTLMSHNFGGIRMPESFILEMFEGKRSLIDVLPYLKYQDQMITMSILAQFMQLGTDGSSGSFALSSDQSRLFLMMLDASAKNISNIINVHAIPELVNYNFASDLYPKLCFKPIDSTKLINTLSSLVSGKIVLPDDDLEDYIRDMLDMPVKNPAKTREEYALIFEENTVKKDEINESSVIDKQQKLESNDLNNKSNNSKGLNDKNDSKDLIDNNQKGSKKPIETNSKKKQYMDKIKDDKINLIEDDNVYDNINHYKSLIYGLFNQKHNEFYDLFLPQVKRLKESVMNRELKDISKIKSVGKNDIKNYLKSKINKNSSFMTEDYFESLINIISNDISEKLKSTFLNEFLYYFDENSKTLHDNFEYDVLEEFNL
jgi:phage gp29-like protein